MDISGRVTHEQAVEALNCVGSGNGGPERVLERYIAQQTGRDNIDDAQAVLEQLRVQNALLREERAAALAREAALVAALELSEIDVSLERTWCRLCRTEDRSRARLCRTEDHSRARDRARHPHEASCILAAHRTPAAEPPAPSADGELRAIPPAPAAYRAKVAALCEAIDAQVTQRGGTASLQRDIRAARADLLADHPEAGAGKESE